MNTPLDQICKQIEESDADQKIDQLANALVNVSADDKKKAQQIIDYIWESIKKVEEQNKLVDEEIALAKAENREPRFKFKRSTTSLVEQLNQATKISIESTGKLVDLSNILVKIKQIESKQTGAYKTFEVPPDLLKDARMKAIREGKENE